MAGADVIDGNALEAWYLVRAARHGVWTARVKVAAARWIERAGNLALEHDALAAAFGEGFSLTAAGTTWRGDLMILVAAVLLQLAQYFLLTLLLSAASAWA